MRQHNDIMFYFVQKHSIDTIYLFVSRVLTGDIGW